MSGRAKVVTGFEPWPGTSTAARTHPDTESIRDYKSILSIDFDPPTFSSGVAEIWGCSFSPSNDIDGSLAATLGSYWATGVSQLVCVAYKFINTVDATTGEVATQDITQTFGTKFLADVATPPFPTFGNSSPTSVVNA